MNQTHLWTVSAIMAGIILVIFLISAPHTRDITSKSSPATATTTPSVAIQDVYKKGVHTIMGSIKAPNVCTTVSAQATLVGDASSTESILVAITTPEDSGVCLEVPSDVQFSTTITAPLSIPITVTVNGVTATTVVP